MATNDQSLERDLEIVNELGLHARSAALLAKTAQQAANGVWIRRSGGEEMDAKQILDILTLAAGRGERVHIRIEDPDDADVLNRIVKLFQDGFGE